MAKQIATPGTCMICKEEVTRRTISQHLLKKHQSESGTSCFLIIATTPYASPYWLAIIANQRSSLQDLDALLRDVWVECCGHMSAFHIMGTEFATTCDGRGIDDDWSESENMHFELFKVLAPGMTFSYEYDFGSTTELKLKVAGLITWDIPKSDVFVAGMNTKPDAICGVCGKPADYHYNESGEGELICSTCIDDEYDECCLLPITNSPRTGECGYEGGIYDVSPIRE